MRNAGAIEQRFKLPLFTFGHLFLRQSGHGHGMFS